MLHFWMYVHGYRVSRKKGSFSKLRYIAYSNCLVIGFDWPPNDSPVLDMGKGNILEKREIILEVKKKTTNFL